MSAITNSGHQKLPKIRVLQHPQPQGDIIWSRQKISIVPVRAWSFDSGRSEFFRHLFWHKVKLLHQGEEIRQPPKLRQLFVFY
jgi:hypothetical protein